MIAGRRAAARAFALLLLTLAAGAQAQDAVAFDSLDRAAGQPVRLIGFWFAAAVESPAPAVVLLHGCSGPYDRRGALAVRLRDYAALLNGQGLHALVVDSLTPRGETELCTQRNGRRTLTQRNRRLDALAALEWLARRSDVDPARVGLLGWSNGGSTVLAAINRRHPDVAAAPRPAAFAIAFYPGCASDLRSGFDSVTPLLMLVGADDDWTPAAPCEALAREAHGTAPTIQVYAGAGHGFDSTAPVRLRADVPNGVHPGQGVHVGGNPSAREASRAALQRFIGDVVRP